MPTLIDAGYVIVKCTITNEDETPSELLVIETGESDEDTRSFTLMGLEAIVALKNAIDEEIERAAQRTEIAKDIP